MNRIWGKGSLQKAQVQRTILASHLKATEATHPFLAL